MSKHLVSALLLSTLLAGCGGSSNPFQSGTDPTNPTDQTDPTDPTDPTNPSNPIGDLTPAELKVNVESARYSPNAAGTDDDQLMLAVSGLDSTPAQVTYARAAALDVPGYVAFKVQEDALDRMFVALAAQSQDGSVRAVTAADGGQFGRYFGGGVYERDGAFSRPAIGEGPGRGQVSYAGEYAAVTNIPVAGTEIIPFPDDANGSLRPGQPGRVTGDIFLNANFSDNQINGSIYNRVLEDVGLTLQDVVLVPAAIAANGTFEGTAEGGVGREGEVGGTFGGIFGGTSAASVAGLVHLTEMAPELENEREHGLFVLTQCGMPGSSAAICGHVATAP